MDVRLQVVSRVQGSPRVSFRLPTSVNEIGVHTERA
jgi:hypothetical protein